jgi:predicted transcriptional regulator
MFGKPNLVRQTLDGKEAIVMSRPRAKELTQRELEVMQIFWKHGSLTAVEARDHLAASKRNLTYTTVANLIRLLYEKDFLRQLNAERPFVYAPARPYEEVSGRLLGDVLKRVFGGSREQLLMRLLEQQPLTERERTYLQTLIQEDVP